MPTSNFDDESIDNASLTTSPTLYPINLSDCGSVYARILYDVDGEILYDDDKDEYLNLSRKTIMDHFNNKTLRCIRHPHDDYRYFIRSEEQKQRFIRERTEGSLTRFNTYYIYRDNDTDSQITNLRNKLQYYKRRSTR